MAKAIKKWTNNRKNEKKGNNLYEEGNIYRAKYIRLSQNSKIHIRLSQVTKIHAVYKIPFIIGYFILILFND